MITATLISQMVVNGLVLGFTLTLVALGLTLIFGILHIVNLAHGEFYMLGAYFGWFFTVVVGINYWVSLFLSILLVSILGVFFERFLLRRYRGNLLSSAIFSLGIILILQTGVLLVFGTEEKGFQGPFKGNISLGGIVLPIEKLAVLLITSILLVVVYFIIWHTKIGRGIRAIAQDSDAARLQGVNLGLVSSTCMIIGSGLAACAGGLLGPIFVVSSTMGGPVLLRSLIAVVVGGMGSIPGVFFASILIGMVQSFATTLAGGAWSELTLFLFLAIVLLVRPRGIFGHA